MNYVKFHLDQFVKLEDDNRKVLGVDIQPEKACIFNCIVCNRGKTVHQGEWHDFGPIEDSLVCLREKIRETGPDIVEIFGPGDILTNTHLKEIIDCVHEMGLPVRLMTNCYLLGIDKHMEIASLAEEVMGAFGIVDDDKFAIYHRPIVEWGFSAKKQAESIIRFSNQYKGKFILRVFLSEGFNDSEQSIKKIKEVVDKTRFDSLWVVTTNKLNLSKERVKQIEAILKEGN